MGCCKTDATEMAYCVRGANVRCCGNPNHVVGGVKTFVGVSFKMQGVR